MKSMMTKTVIAGAIAIPLHQNEPQLLQLGLNVEEMHLYVATLSVPVEAKIVSNYKLK